MTNKERFLAYLRCYERKDIDGIAEMLSADIVLRDWKILVKGRTNALSETRKNFEASKSLQIEPLRILESEGSVAGELKIVVNGEAELYVVDVLDFAPDGKITSIRAYLGRSD